jgi:hypothetical protein
MIRNEKLWDEITARLAELVDRDGVEFLPARDGLTAELSVNVLIGPDGEAELQLRNNTTTDAAGAPIMGAVRVSRSLYQRLNREKERATNSLRKRHGKNWGRLVTRPRPVEASEYAEILAGRA